MEKEPLMNEQLKKEELKKEGLKRQELKSERFTKDQLVASIRYKNKRDLLEAVLEQGKSYSFQQAEQIMKAFLKGGC